MCFFSDYNSILQCSHKITFIVLEIQYLSFTLPAFYPFNSPTATSPYIAQLFSLFVFVTYKDETYSLVYVSHNL